MSMVLAMQNLHGGDPFLRRTRPPVSQIVTRRRIRQLALRYDLLCFHGINQSFRSPLRTPQVRCAVQRRLRLLVRRPVLPVSFPGDQGARLRTADRFTTATM
jgi:hypothetical protein